MDTKDTYLRLCNFLACYCVSKKSCPVVMILLQITLLTNMYNYSMSNRVWAYSFIIEISNSHLNIIYTCLNFLAGRAYLFQCCMWKKSCQFKCAECALNIEKDFLGTFEQYQTKEKIYGKVIIVNSFGYGRFLDPQFKVI